MLHINRCLSFGVGSIQNIDQPVPLLDGNQDKTFNNFGENGQWANGIGCPNGQTEGGIEKKVPSWQQT